MGKLSIGWKVFIGSLVVVALYLGGAYFMSWVPFQKKTTVPANNSTGGGSGSGGGAGGGGNATLFDGPGDGITYANLVAPSTILRKGVKDPAVIRLKNLINIVRASLGQKAIPVNDYFGQVCEEALQWCTSATGKGVDGQSIKEITIQTIDAEEASKNLFKPKG
jgi:hypothetical protein